MRLNRFLFPYVACQMENRTKLSYLLHGDAETNWWIQLHSFFENNLALNFIINSPCSKYRRHSTTAWNVSGGLCAWPKVPVTGSKSCSYRTQRATSSHDHFSCSAELEYTVYFVSGPRDDADGIGVIDKLDVLRRHWSPMFVESSTEWVLCPISGSQLRTSNSANTGGKWFSCLKKEKATRY